MVLVESPQCVGESRVIAVEKGDTAQMLLKRYCIAEESNLDFYQRVIANPNRVLEGELLIVRDKIN